MSAGGPFRSHLLQQWGRSTQGRAPVAVATWLKSSPADSSNQDAEGKTRDGDGQHPIRHPPHYLPQGPSISTLDSVAYGMEAASTAASWDASPHHPHPTPQASTRTFATSASIDFRTGKIPTEAQAPLLLFHHDVQESMNSPARRTRRLLSTASIHGTDHPPVVDEGHHEVTAGINPSMTTALAFQSLLMNRRTATHWKTPIHEQGTSSVLPSAEETLKRALDRAVACAQMAPNHKRTEPFSFKRFLMGSKAAHHLAAISYNVTLRKTGSEPNAHAKRLKWRAIPGFLVMLVHENQSPTSERSSVVLCETDDYALLPYSPPETERQLEDYAAACAAVQNVLLSLHAEGIGSKWATGPVIHTPAFRDLVQAQPSDRVAALIMVGGSTEFASDREERMTSVRRHRRRSIHGDLLQDLA